MALNIALPVRATGVRRRADGAGRLPVTVIPPPGARLDASKTSPSNDTVQFLVGDVTYWLHARRWSGSLDEFTTKSATSAAPGRGCSADGGRARHHNPAGSARPCARYTMTDRSGRYVVFSARASRYGSLSSAGLRVST